MENVSKLNKKGGWKKDVLGGIFWNIELVDRGTPTVCVR